MSATGSPEVKRANKASTSDIQNTLNAVSEDDFEIRAFANSKDLPNDIRDAIWQIFEENMYSLYANSPTFGWDPKAKKKELFHKHSRFLIASPANQSDILAGYTMFRFEHDQDENLLYWSVTAPWSIIHIFKSVSSYELQVRDLYQGKSLGKILMGDIESIAQNWKMEKIMLTVLKGESGGLFPPLIPMIICSSSANIRACQFYRALGFALDPSNPTDDDEGFENVDYEILSKIVRASL
ncbi:hypothetical protein AAF712_000961 [Marasmius tenuissimus]|uniref:N-alpha-acetyltransferase 40 n=1 Tax=Marasmius tenuissimus TaxID=585030 RepID=A0ABR3AEL7_9AGAR